MTRRRKLAIAIPSAYVLLLILVTSVSHATRSSDTSHPVADAPTSNPSTSSTPAPSSRTPKSTRPAPGNAHPELAGNDRSADNGDVLPDRSVTPGAIDPKVTQSNIDTTICRSGYSSSIRPDSGYTTSLKRRQLSAGYTYNGDTVTGDYEEDHLISLELGGSPTSVRNLWPEPYETSGGARKKDKIEDTLHGLVCAHTITLAKARHAEATNWSSAYHRYITKPAKEKAARAAARRAAVRREARQQAQASRAAASSAAAPPPATSCTTTSSGSCIQGGEFCPESSYGEQGTDADGDVYTCKGDATHPHWED